MSNHAHRRPHEIAEPARPAGFFRRLLRFIGPNQGSGRSPVAATVSSRIDAELLAGFLRNTGIKAVVSADDEGGLSPALQTGGRVRVVVPRGQHSRARQLLDERE